MNRLTDTSPEAEKVLVECYRRMPMARKWQNLAEDFAFARMLHAVGMRSRLPGVSLAAVQADWIRSSLGYSPPFLVGEPDMEPHLQSLHPPLRRVIAAMDEQGIGYAIGGSVASSLFGIGRLTRDADLTAEPFLGREQEFVDRFHPDDFYVSVDAVRMANRDRFSFNLIHFQSGFKIDVFIRKDIPFEVEAFRRRGKRTFPDDPEHPLMVYSAEDIVLFKLNWYRLGNESCIQQWKDILGVMQAQALSLDNAYLDHWAANLGVLDLLIRVREEV